MREGWAIERSKPRREVSARPPVSPARRRRAIAKYSEAIALDPTFVRAYLSRAHSRRRLRDLVGSRSDAEAAYALRPQDPLDYESIAFAFDRPTQRRIIRTGLSRTTPGSWEHLHLGWASANSYWYEGRFDLQLRVLRRLLRRFAELGKRRLASRHYYDVGVVLNALGRHKAAEEAFRVAVSDGSGNTELARLSIVESRIYRGDLRGALQALDRFCGRMDAGEISLIRGYINALIPDSPAPSKQLVRRVSTPSSNGNEEFMGAIVLLRGGHGDLARPRLRKYVARCESNPSEWGVTKRWEIAKAKELLR